MKRLCPSHRTMFSAAFTLLMFIWIAGASAQTNRQAATDENGQMKVKPFESTPCVQCQSKKISECTTCSGGRKKLEYKCPECNGKKQATCRPCLGTGSTWDPFILISCPRCDARGFHFCILCEGELRLKAPGGRLGDKCNLCDKKGAFACKLCLGSRSVRLELPGTKPLESATLEELEALKKKILPLFDSSKKYSEPNGRGSIRDFDALMEKTLPIYPMFKEESKQAKMLWETIDKKEKSLSDIETAKANCRRVVAFAVNAITAQSVNAIEFCIGVHEYNRKKAATEQKKPENQN